MTTATAETTTEFRIVPLKEVRESKSNPRRHFDEKAMKDIIASVKEKGILVPLLVREIPAEQAGGVKISSYFEIVAGARRYRASKAAGLEEVPVLVRDLTDEQALEAQVIENLQRADVHPLDEAEGYAALMAKTNQDVAAIALKVGKSESYVYQRLKLVELVASAKAAFFGGSITAGHAILIARLQPKDQVDVLEEVFFDRQYRKEKRDEAISVRALETWIHENVLLNLSSTPWKKDDATLIEKAGPCTTCPKRTGCTPQLFPEVTQKDVCTDRTCFQAKGQAFLDRAKAELEAKGQKVQLVFKDYNHGGNPIKGALDHHSYLKAAGKKKCPTTVVGLYVDGTDRGKSTVICTNKECRVHREVNHYSDGGGGGSRSAAEEKAHQAGLHKERIRVRARFLIFKAMLQAIKKLDRVQLNQIAEDLSGAAYEEAFNEAYPDSPSRQQIQKFGEADLARLIVGANLAGHEDKAIIDEAKRQKVKVEQLQKQAKAECDAELANKERTKKWKNRVASQAKSFDEPTCTGCGCTTTTPCADPRTLTGTCGWKTKPNAKTNAGLCTACPEGE